MSWADCGEDSKGRPIGYGWPATCDQEDCYELINRGLGFACGEMHGENGDDCEGYFCHEKAHITFTSRGQRCLACAALIEAEEPDEDYEDAMYITAERVRAEHGADLLDNVLGPEWTEAIDLDTLSLRSSCNCTLGQVSIPGSYGQVLKVLDLSLLDARSMGFMSSEATALESLEAMEAEFDRLDATWRDLIRERRVRGTG